MGELELFASFGADNVLDLTVGALELALAAVVLRYFWRFGRIFPWLLVLTCFLALRGVDRVYTGAFEHEPAAFALGLDVLVLAVLVLLIVGVERMIHGLRLAAEAARSREEEYGRAIADYRRLARHRLANPITAILGSVRTLRDFSALDPATRRALLDAIHDQALRLRDVSLEPDSALAREERGLRPRPQVSEDAARLEVSAGGDPDRS